MHPSKIMTKVIGGKRYSVSTATELASDEVLDSNGHFEHYGRNVFLYRTPGGAFFRVDLTQWQGEQDTITALSREDAMQLYEELPDHSVGYEEAFDAVVEEASAGRPTYYGQSMRQTSVWLPDEMIAWLKERGNMGDQIRKLISEAMTK